MAKRPSETPMNSRPMSAASRPASPTSSEASRSPARNSPVPRPQAVKREISHEQIAKRAYEIFSSGQGGSPQENWLRAERELRGY